jgi:hypothetical protein
MSQNNRKNKGIFRTEEGKGDGRKGDRRKGDRRIY